MLPVTIIIVNYKSWDFLQQCLGAIENTKLAPEVIVVDNASEQTAFEEFSRKYPWVQFIASAENLGFGKANNLAAKQASNETLLFLNPDTELNAGALERMFNFQKLHQQYRIVSVQQHEELSKHFLLFPTFWRLFGVLRALAVKQNREQFKVQKSGEIAFITPDWVSGSVVMINKSWFEQLGGWDEDFWMYYEDVDLCQRNATAGGKCALICSEKIKHVHGGASRKTPEIAAKSKFEVLKSRSIYIKKHFEATPKAFALAVEGLGNFINLGILALLSIPFFFIDKLKVYRRMFVLFLRQR